MAALVAAVAAAGMLAFPLSGCGGGGAGARSDPGRPLEALRASVPLRVRLEPSPKQVAGPSYPLATVRPGHTIDLHSSPGGRILDRVGARTEFGSMRVFWIEKVRGDWFGVPASELPDGELAWVRDDSRGLELSQTRFWITAEVSRRRLELRYGNRVLDRFPVGVGSPGSPTPLGDFAITDGLVGKGLGPWYGCCVLALSGHQPNLPAGWIGGNRMAIHGTPGAVGGATSRGCLRASDPDMISLFARVPLGTPVFIRA
ncbi:MAG TPA: L,D-transpeptidase [Solirubrobacterales bacterium]|nr:L,D-transpeptidase [Solirubrobacterales bacterium]